MDHATIERERYIDRYLLAQLDEQEAERFEEHYLGCAQCLDELEAAEQLQQGLRRAATEDLVQVAGTLSWWSRLSRVSRRYPGLLLAALVVLLLLPAGLGWRLTQVQDDLSQAQSQLDAALAPQAGTLITYLDAERSTPEAGGEPTQRIRLPEQPGWIVLSVQVEAGLQGVEAELWAPDGTVIWRADGLSPDALGNLTVSVHSSRLRPGDYELRLRAEGASAPRCYKFRVLPSQ